jgi:hypothetical protein
VALSYAGSGDLSVVAALVRAAACLGLDGPWLKEALVYLLDQQQSAGCFGLLALGPSLISTKDEIAEASMRLTVEVLWALGAARYALGEPKARRDAQQRVLPKRQRDHRGGLGSTLAPDTANPRAL